MKIVKFIAVSVIALACSAFSAKAGNALTSNNGLAAGQALAYLYSAYKADSKIDLAKPANISNIISLITNIKGLKAQKNNTTNASTAFINALIGNSANLVTPQNSPSVLGALAGISSLDTSSLTNMAATAATQAATTAATNAATKALGGLFSKAKSTAAAAQPAATTAAAATSEAMTAVNALTNIFNLVK